MEILWPDERRDPARHRFHITISELRQTLTAATETGVIINQGGRYRLNASHVSVDLWHLHAAVERAASTLDPRAHTDALHEIIALYTAPVADGEDWLWVLPYREATRRHVLDAYIRLAEAETDPRAALALIQDATRLDPYNEDLYQRAMRLHAILNNPDGVHRTLRAITERLAQLDTAVSAQTGKLAAELLTQLGARRRFGDH
jgi:DNA-binding SARP family transcriptional activator